MNEISKPAQPAGLTLRIITAVVAANGLALTAHAGSCDGTINAIKSWLQASNSATAVVTSNQPPAAPGMIAEVTYAKIPINLGAAGSLVSSDLGTRYYDDHSWYKPAPPAPPCNPPGCLNLGQGPGPYPFSPDATDKVGLTITSTGTVSIIGVVSGGFTIYTFTASCSPQGVIYGEPPLSNKAYAVLPVPFYSITFEKNEKNGPPPK